MRIFSLLALSSVLFTNAIANITNFIGLGDWGGYNLGSYHKTNVYLLS